ncbi:prepilin-type N-terminal cleavage/methylation domain-containing protein [uncultured Massilia sp.]|uniref:prepilin-type N-terminal cleavage/methylation domain-containing protein n=1 Tax=uncultured Massilia sp. TaxID=169973 RepID=UPI0025896117|nr:prepilin-type N-terminal cleavage/methylation domain-containing protein [uncultured Massilia sp.]
MSSKRMETMMRMRGVTLVELVIAIVIIAVALAGLVAAFTRATRASVDPLLTQQMIAIGESMLEEAMLKPYTNNKAQEASRADYTDIWDYNGYPADSPVTDVAGNAIPGLERYRVTVRVSPVALTDVPQAQAARISVTVRSGNESLVLHGWRTEP